MSTLGPTKGDGVSLADTRQDGEEEQGTNVVVYVDESSVLLRDRQEAGCLLCLHHHKRTPTEALYGHAKGLSVRQNAAKKCSVFV